MNSFFDFWWIKVGSFATLATVQKLGLVCSPGVMYVIKQCFERFDANPSIAACARTGDDIAGQVTNDRLLIMVNKATIKIDWQLSGSSGGSTVPLLAVVSQLADTIGRHSSSVLVLH